MPVTYSSGRSSGVTSKAITITTNLKPRANYVVRVEAYVESPTMRPPKFYAEPRSLEYQPPDRKKPGSGQVELFNKFDHEVLVKVVGYSETLGMPELSKDKLKAGDKADLTFEFAKSSKRGKLHGSVTLEVLTDEETVMRYTVPIVYESI